MIVGRLCITYDRGLKRNKARDVGLTYVPVTTEDGGIVRGLGTHFESPEAKERVKECENVEYKIRREFKLVFLPSPLPGLFILPDRYAGQRALSRVSGELAIEISDLRIQCRVVTYTLTTDSDVPSAELREWEGRIKKQLNMAPLGRAKEAKAQGLDVLTKLAMCPVLAQTTREDLLALIASAQVGDMERVEFKRKLNIINVEVDVSTIMEPRRVPVTPDVSPETMLDLSSRMVVD